MHRIMFVIGARPQFFKTAPIIKEILNRRRSADIAIVHSGQHYDPEMSSIFFRELQIPKPIADLHVGSGSHATQTAKIMQRLEKELVLARPDIVLVPGDTNTTLGGALAAAKLNIPVAHVEAGLRSNDLTMPEEINRRLTDHCSTLLFSPTRNAASNLRKEGFQEQIHLTGDTMVDALETAMPVVEKRENATLNKLRATRANFVLVTLHRPSNVDDPSRLGQIHHALRKIARRLPVIFPAHPRTRSRLAQIGLLSESKKYGVNLIAPQGYVESLALMKNSACLLTDSGGMQKEAFLLRIPCVTLRPNTEWPETLQANANRLVTDPQRIPKAVIDSAFDETLRRRLRHVGNPFGDGRAAGRIVGIVEKAMR